MFTNVSVKYTNTIHNKLIHVITNTESFYWIIRLNIFFFLHFYWSLTKTREREMSKSNCYIFWSTKAIIASDRQNHIFLEAFVITSMTHRQSQLYINFVDFLDECVSRAEQ